ERSAATEVVRAGRFIQSDEDVVALQQAALVVPDRAAVHRDRVEFAAQGVERMPAQDTQLGVNATRFSEVLVGVKRLRGRLGIDRMVGDIPLEAAVAVEGELIENLDIAAEIAAGVIGEGSDVRVPAEDGAGIDDVRTADAKRRSIHRGISLDEVS